MVIAVDVFIAMVVITDVQKDKELAATISHTEQDNRETATNLTGLFVILDAFDGLSRGTLGGGGL